MLNPAKFFAGFFLKFMANSVMEEPRHAFSEKPFFEAVENIQNILRGENKGGGYN